MSTLTRNITIHHPDPDASVKLANDWMDLQKNYGMAVDRCEVQYEDAMWHLTVFLRNDRDRQHFNHTTDAALWVFQKNLFNGGFSDPVSVNGEMHYFGSRKA